MLNVQKSAALGLLMTLVVLSSWQIAVAADGVRGRHSLIHRPQIHPAPALSAPHPEFQSSPRSGSTPLQTVRRKVVKRPVASASPIAEVSSIDPSNSAQIDVPPPPPESYPPDDGPPEVEMLPPPEPQESPNTQ